MKNNTKLNVLLIIFLMLATLKVQSQTPIKNGMRLPVAKYKSLVWPDDAPVGHRAVSDEWIIKNHDLITQMKPRVLVINFANGVGGFPEQNKIVAPFGTEELSAKAKALVTLMRESSELKNRINLRYRSKVIANKYFLEPKILKIVDLRDNPNDPHVVNSNSKLFPHGEFDMSLPGLSKGTSNVDYFLLMTDVRIYGAKWGYRHPTQNRYLSLLELFQRGIVHEVFMFANQIDPLEGSGNPASEVTRQILESTSIAQVYDANFKKVNGKFVRYFGPEQFNVSDLISRRSWNSLPWGGLSLRVNFQNVARGVGCTLHGLGHDLEYRHGETIGYPAVIPWLKPHFQHFADLNLNETQNSPFRSLYAAQLPIKYELCNSEVCQKISTGSGSIENYKPACGNLHFPPGAESGYDYGNKNSVNSTCENFSKGLDQAQPLNSSRWVSANDSGEVKDCGGDYVRYWFQRMPNWGDSIINPNKAVLKNWWPFLYY